MAYYCPYCNRQQDGSVVGKTDEHFIPRSIGGGWAITACYSCNQACGVGSDAYFAGIAWDYRMIRSGRVTASATAVMRDGDRIPGRFSVAAQDSWDRDFRPAPGFVVDESCIDTIDIDLGDDHAWAKGFAPKVALGAIWYLLKRYRAPARCVRRFKTRVMSLLRERTVGDHLVDAFPEDGISGVPSVVVKVMEGSRVDSMQASFDKPEKRRHYVSIEDAPQGLTVTCILYSEWYFFVRLTNGFLGLDGLAIASQMMLPNLPDIESRVGTMQHKRGTIRYIWDPKSRDSSA